VIAGGTGFIGERLVTALVTTDEDVVVLSRGDSVPAGARLAKWDGRTVGEWARELDGAYAVVNLAGEPVGQRWSAEVRRRIVDSRTQSVGAICEAIQACAQPPSRWINGSAVGFYGSPGANEVDEQSPMGEGFLAETCRAWEEAVERCPVTATAKCRIRIGMVLGHEGALKALAKLAKLGLGGQVGSGDQPVSWIHLDDLVGMIGWLLDLSRPPEVVNGTSPNPVPNAEFMRSIREVLKVPFGMPAPAFGVRLIGKTIGPDAELMLGGARVIPRKALRLGYRYRHPDLIPALEEILGR
jgi:uncharacterized protein (TIGR01777 family)